MKICYIFGVGFVEIMIVVLVFGIIVVVVVFLFVDLLNWWCVEVVVNSIVIDFVFLCIE